MAAFVPASAASAVPAPPLNPPPLPSSCLRLRLRRPGPRPLHDPRCAIRDRRYTGRMIGDNLLGPEPTRLAADPEVDAALAAGGDPEGVVRAHPESPAAWAALADRANAEGREIEAYAFARVGYHRGLDALRRAGWRGAGPVPWSHEPNRGVLRALYALRRAAGTIGEESEVRRLSEFLDGADPEAIRAIEGERRPGRSGH